MRLSQATFGDIAHIDVGFAFPSGRFVSEPPGIPLLRGDNIGQGAIRWDRTMYWPPTESWNPRYSLLGGDVVLAMDRPWISGGLKYATVRTTDAPSLLVQRVARLRAKPGNDQGYLASVIGSPTFRDYILSVQTGTSIPHISARQIAAFPMVAHALLDQLAIAEVLGALDEKIVANGGRASSALALGDALWDRVLDPSWPSSTLGALADQGSLLLGDGYRTKRAEHGYPGLRILRAGDVRDGQILPLGADFVSDAFLPHIGQRASQPGDVVLTTKGTVGRVAVVPADIEQVVYSPQLCYFRVVDDEALDRGYLAAWFRSSDLQEQASLRMHKSDMAPYINLQDIRTLRVPLPAAEEQRRQGETQRALLAVHDGAQAESRRLADLRDTLLPELMSGRLRVKDAEHAVEELV